MLSMPRRWNRCCGSTPAEIASQRRLVSPSGLSKQTGWELQGELALGFLRSELNDPAGAAGVLRRALARPEASRLIAEENSKYHKILVREPLTDGEDEGRYARRSCRLLDSRIGCGSVLAFESDCAGVGRNYRGRDRRLRRPVRIGSFIPLSREPSPYVGEARCAECHAEIFEAHQASRHSSTLLRGGDSPSCLIRIVRAWTRMIQRSPRSSSGNRARSGSRPTHRARCLERSCSTHSARLDHYTSLVGTDEHGTPHILRLSHYQSGRDSGWVRTTGHSADASGGRDFLGKPLDALDGIHRCLFCHSTNPTAVIRQSGPESSDRGIGCERCHGPGSLHVKAIEVKFRDRAIVNPKRATAAEQASALRPMPWLSRGVVTASH